MVQRNPKGVTHSPGLGLSGCTHTYTHTPPPGPPRCLLPDCPPCSSPHNLLQLAEVLTLPQQLAQWFHMHLAEAAAREPAGGGETSQSWGGEPLRPSLPWLVLVWPHPSLDSLGLSTSTTSTFPTAGPTGTPVLPLGR